MNLTLHPSGVKLLAIALVIIMTVTGLSYFQWQTVYQQQRQLDLLRVQRERMYIDLFTMAKIGDLASLLDSAQMLSDEVRYEALKDASEHWNRVEACLALMIGLKDDYSKPDEPRPTTWAGQVQVPESRMPLMLQIGKARLAFTVMSDGLTMRAFGLKQAEFCTSIAGLLREIEKTLRNNDPSLRALASDGKDAIDRIEPPLVKMRELTDAYQRQ